MSITVGFGHGTPIPTSLEISIPTASFSFTGIAPSALLSNPVSPVAYDDFSSGGLGGAVGMIWRAVASGPNGLGMQQSISTVNPPPGFTHYLALRYIALSHDTGTERGFQLNVGLTQMWLSFWLFYPLNYTHFNDGSSNNNKFFRWFPDHDTPVYGASTEIGTGGSLSRLGFEHNRAGGGIGFYLPVTNAFGNPIQTFIPGVCALGTWNFIQMEMALCSGAGATNGIARIAVNGVTYINITNLPYSNYLLPMAQGYFFGAPNGPPSAECTIGFGGVKFYNQNPGWF